MRHGAEQVGPFSVADDDPRLTKIGRFLRKWKLDEFPQIINVLKGDMALVGPRPEVKHYINQLEPSDRKLILSVRPGIIDYASIKFRNEGRLLAKKTDSEFFYAEIIRPEKTRLQIKYIQEKCWCVNLKIILQLILIYIFRVKSKYA